MKKKKKILKKLKKNNFFLNNMSDQNLPDNIKKLRELTE